MSDEDNEYVLVAIKKNLVDTLLVTLKPLIYSGILSIYIDTCKHAEKTHTYDIIRQFQSGLKNIQNWNNIIVQEESDRIKGSLKDNYELDSMIMSIIVVQVKILAFVRNKNKTDLDIKVPKGENFIHRVYIKTGEKIYYSRNILELIQYSNEDSKIRNEILDIIGECINDTLTSYIPINEILNDYIGSLFNRNKYTTKNGQLVPDDSDSEDEEKGNEFGSDITEVPAADEAVDIPVNDDLIFPPKPSDFVDPNALANDLADENLLKFDTIDEAAGLDDFYNDGSSKMSFGSEENTEQLAQQTDSLVDALGVVSANVELEPEPNFFEMPTPPAPSAFPANPYASSLDEVPEKDPTSAVSDIPVF